MNTNEKFPILLLFIAALACNESKMSHSGKTDSNQAKDENPNSNQYSAEVPTDDGGGDDGAKNEPINPNVPQPKKPAKAVLPANIAGAFLAGYAGKKSENPIVGINLKCEKQNNAFVWQKELCDDIEGSLTKLLIEAQHIIQQCKTLSHQGKDYELRGVYPTQYSEKWAFEFEVLGGPLNGQGSIINCNFETIAGNQLIRIPVNHPNTVPDLGYNLAEVPDRNYFFYNGRGRDSANSADVSFIFDYIVTSDILNHMEKGMQLSFENFQEGDEVLLIGGIVPAGRSTNLKDLIANRPHIKRRSLTDANQVIFTPEEIQQTFPEYPMLTLYISSRGDSLHFNQLRFGHQDVFNDNPYPLSTELIWKKIQEDRLRRVSSNGMYSTKTKDGASRIPIDFALVANKFDRNREAEGCGHAKPVTLHFEIEYKPQLSIFDHLPTKVDTLVGQDTIIMRLLERSCEEFQSIIEAAPFLPYLQLIDIDKPLAGNYYFMKERPQHPEFPALAEYLLFLKNGQESHFLRADLRTMIFFP
ncbi:MAG: hypothetical protein KBD78_16300 [Oligoflexales bacterium]|nr:hypothetical protein [Oligoflexales bacterium]